LREPVLEDRIGRTMDKEAAAGALAFVARLRSLGLAFETFGEGYWKGKPYWAARYRDEPVLYVLVEGSGPEDGGWTVWSGEGESGWPGEADLDAPLREMAWKNVVRCARCGNGCHPGETRILFGKEFNNVCRTALKFVNPSLEALAFLARLAESRIRGLDRAAAASPPGTPKNRGLKTKNGILRKEFRGVKKRLFDGTTGKK